MDLGVSRIHYPITVLGPGRRFGLWVQGCSIGCAGCMSRDTWHSEAGDTMDTAVLSDLVIAARDDEGLDGLTISGGEPFEQPEGVADLIERTRAQWPEIDIFVYSGYSLDALRIGYSDLLGEIDAVMTGPFVQHRTTEASWRGSANQVLTVLNPNAEDRYRDAADGDSSRLQVSVDQAAVWITGIPRRGDLERMRTTLARAGLVLEDVSWRS